MEGGEPVNFLAIQNAVLSDRFKETQRSDAKNWINHRYGWIWTLEPWTFRKRSTAVTITNGQVVSPPAGLGPVRALILSDGTRLAYLEPTVFFDRYTGQSATATPDTYTVLAGTVYVGPTNSGSLSATLIDDQQVTMLNVDGDTPALPAEFHFALVHGGAAEGLKLQNDPTWLAFEQDFQASIQAMRASYLEESRDKMAEASWGRWNPWGV